MTKVDSSSHFVLFTLKQSDPSGWIILGRTLQRFLLETTRLGIASAFMNQPCEVKKVAALVPAKLNIPEEIPQLLLRIGYASPQAWSPRRAIDDIIMTN